MSVPEPSGLSTSGPGAAICEAGGASSLVGGGLVVAVCAPPPGRGGPLRGLQLQAGQVDQQREGGNDDGRRHDEGRCLAGAQPAGDGGRARRRSRPA